MRGVEDRGVIDNQKQLWLAHVVSKGLELGILRPQQVLEHLTPEVLSTHLPPGVMSNILSSALGAGKLTPEGIIGSAPPDILANYIPSRILWACISSAAEQAQIATPASAMGRSGAGG